MTIISDDLELQVLHQTCSRLRSVVSRTTWCTAMQRRSSRISGVLAILLRVVQPRGAYRAKIAGGWAIRGTDVAEPLLVLVTRSHGKRIADLEDALVVHVHRADLVDVARLERLAQYGSIKLVFEPRPSS